MDEPDFAELVTRSQKTFPVSGTLIIRPLTEYSATMVAVVRQQTSEVTEQARVESLERMLAVMCDYLTELVEDTLDGKALGSRESRLQREAFEERRNRALEFLGEGRHRPLSLKIGSLERLIEGLECSLVYFSGLVEALDVFADSPTGAVLTNRR